MVFWREPNHRALPWLHLDWNSYPLAPDHDDLSAPRCVSSPWALGPRWQANLLAASFPLSVQTDTPRASLLGCRVRRRADAGSTCQPPPTGSAYAHPMGLRGAAVTAAPAGPALDLRPGHR